MTKEQQAIYYEEADRQRQLHKQLYPEWSNGQNYVSTPFVKRKSQQKVFIRYILTDFTCFVGQKKEKPKTKKANLQRMD